MKKVILLSIVIVYHLFSQDTLANEKKYMMSLTSLVKKNLKESQFKFIPYHQFHEKSKEIFNIKMTTENVALYTSCIANKFPEKGIPRYNSADGADIFILNKDGFITYSFDLSKDNILEMESIIRLNKYLFNKDKKQLDWLLKHAQHLLYQLLYYFHYTDDYFLLEKYLDENDISKIDDSWVWVKACKRHFSLNDTLPNWYEDKTIYNEVELKLNIFKYFERKLKNEKFDSPFANMYLRELLRIERSITFNKIMTNREMKMVQQYISKFILKYIKNENKCFINNSTYKSLYSFCKATGIKESEIRALNPWINKSASNIPANAEIIISNKEKNNDIR